MDLTIYDIIQGPVITDKAYKLNKGRKKLVLKVHPHANKPLIKEALKKLFNVEVDDVNVVNRKGKVRRVGKRVIQCSGTKRAIITLAEGHTLDLFDQGGSSVVAADEGGAKD